MTSTSARAAIAAACLAAGIAVAASSPSVAADKKYTIYLSNGLIGNDWLQQMQRSAEVAVKKARSPDGSISTSRRSRTPPRRRSTRSTTSSPPSPTRSSSMPLRSSALDPTMERACAAGIVVVSFSQVVTADVPLQAQHQLGPASTTTSRPGLPTCSAARARSSSTAACPARRSRRPRTRKSRRCSARSRASRSSAGTPPTMSSAPNRPASRACSPPTRRSTAS